MSVALDQSTGYARFRRAVEEGVLRPGTTVTQSALCRALGMSLTPLRETLVVLQEFGLVEARPRAGIRIVYPEVDFIRENFQFRRLLEIAALDAFAETVTDDWLSGIRSRHESILSGLTQPGEQQDYTREVAELDATFHRDIVAAMQNAEIASTHRRLFDNIAMAQHVHRRPAYRRHLIETLEEHLVIIAALEAGRVAEVRDGMELHLKGAIHRILSL